MEPKKEALIQDCIDVHVAILMVCMFILIIQFTPEESLFKDGRIYWKELYIFFENASGMMIILGHSLPVLWLFNVAASRWIGLRVARDLAFVYSLMATYGLAAFIFGTAYKEEIRDMMNMARIYIGVS